MKYIVTAVDYRNGRAIDFPFPGVRQTVYTFPTNKIDLDRTDDYLRALRGVDTVFCEEGDVEGVVAAMTNHFSGSDIIAYKVESISVRSPGELKTKAITKDGVLPT